MGPLIPPPKDYGELSGRPAFRTLLDTKQHELERILTEYNFPKSIACGQKHCRRGHLSGYLVRTKDGLETNIGHICGKKAFGKENWRIARDAFEKIRERDGLLKRMADLKASRNEIERQINEMKSARHGARWVESVRASLVNVIGGDLYGNLETLQKRRDFSVSTVRLRTNTEIQKLVDQTGMKREQLTHETLVHGRLCEMPWLSFDFTGVFDRQILEPLAKLCSIDVDALETPSLRKWIKQFDGLDRSLEEAKRAAESCLSFFQTSNLDLLVIWIPERHKVRRAALEQWRSSARYAELVAGAL